VPIERLTGKKLNAPVMTPSGRRASDFLSPMNRARTRIGGFLKPHGAAQDSRAVGGQR
jgi:hypothetical protein